MAFSLDEWRGKCYIGIITKGDEMWKIKVNWWEDTWMDIGREFSSYENAKVFGNRNFMKGKYKVYHEE